VKVFKAERFTLSIRFDTIIKTNQIQEADERFWD
jgi:hypothetical protein